MKTEGKKSLNYYIRSLHRDIGFLVLGFAIIFATSGIVLIFRDTNTFKQEKVIEKTIAPNLDNTELAKELHLKEIQVLKEENGIVYFKNGSYNKTSGSLSYTSNELPGLLKKLSNIHKSPSKNVMHWFTLVFGILLLFLAISSFWMFKPKTKTFRRGIIIASIGFIIAITLVFFL